MATGLCIVWHHYFLLVRSKSTKNRDASLRDGGVGLHRRRAGGPAPHEGLRGHLCSAEPGTPTGRMRTHAAAHRTHAHAVVPTGRVRTHDIIPTGRTRMLLYPQDSCARTRYYTHRRRPSSSPSSRAGSGSGSPRSTLRTRARPSAPSAAARPYSTAHRRCPLQTGACRCDAAKGT